MCKVSDLNFDILIAGARMKKSVHLVRFEMKNKAKQKTAFLSCLHLPRKS